MKVIFLDFDGVVNTEVYIASVADFCKRTEQNFDRIHDRYGMLFDPIAVTMLSCIIEQTGAKIVVSSSWRLSGLDKMKQMWQDRKLPGEVIDITPSFLQERKTTLCRGEEVQAWIEKWKSENPGEEFFYVALDDDTDLLPLCEGHFVQTDACYGITRKDAKKCIEILCKE